MRVGHLTYRPDERGELRFKGYVRTLAITVEFHGRTAQRRTDNPDAPTHDVFAKSGDQWVQVGQAWEKKIKNGANAGKVFLSMTLDDPSFERPLYVSAFPVSADDEGTHCEVVWSRPKGAAKAATAPAGGDPRDGDEIPFG